MAKAYLHHGAGVVIGETAEIGNNVTIIRMHLGARKEKGKRHPTIGNTVRYISAKVLGSSHRRDNVKIGANSVVLKDKSKN